MTQASDWLLAYFINSLWQVPVLFALGWLVARFVRPLGLASEHAAWIITCLLQSLIPACTLIPGAWWNWLRHSSPLTAGVSVVVGSGSVAGPLHMPTPLFAALTMGYAAVGFYFIARFIWRAMRLISMQHHATPLTFPAQIEAHLLICLKQFAITNVSVLASNEIVSPVSFGFRRKFILLPPGLNTKLSSTDLQTVFAHECAHIHRRDFITNLFSELISLLVSYHPFFWAAREKMIETRELVCDELASELTGRAAYARSLLHLAALLLQETSPSITPAIGIFDARIFERRIMQLTRKTQTVRMWKRSMITASCVALCLFTCGSAIALRIHVDPTSAPDNQNKVSPAVQPAIIPSGVMAGNKLSGVNPVYPPAAKQKRIQGTVVLSAVINKEGRVEQLLVKSGPAELGPPSIEAVKQWIYKPYMLNGKPVAVQTIVNVTYALGR